MSKTYILEPTEITFENGEFSPENIILSKEDVLAIPQDALAQIGDTILKFHAIVEDSDVNPPYVECYFTDNGEGDDVEDPTISVFSFRYCDPTTSPFGGSPIPAKNDAGYYVQGNGVTGTYTVSIYTETEDEDPKPYIDEKLSKNVTYTDHPHNNWEEVLSKKGDPKTGYNTIEKLASSTNEGGSSDGESSSGGAKIIYATVEPSADGQTYTCDHDGMELIQAIKDGNLVVIVDHVNYNGIGIAYAPDEITLIANICYCYIDKSGNHVDCNHIEYNQEFSSWHYD